MRSARRLVISEWRPSLQLYAHTSRSVTRETLALLRPNGPNGHFETLLRMLRFSPAVLHFFPLGPTSHHTPDQPKAAGRGAGVMLMSDVAGVLTWRGAERVLWRGQSAGRRRAAFLTRLHLPLTYPRGVGDRSQKV